MNRGTLEFLNSDIFKSILTILVSASTTYLLTKSTEGKNDKKEIYKIQLEKIFLPLYLLASKMYINNANNAENATIANLINNMSQKRAHHQNVWNKKPA